MDDGRVQGPRRTLPYERVTSILGRALGMRAEEVLAAFVPAGAEHLAQVVELRQRVLGSVAWNDSAYLAWRYRFGSPARGRGDCWVFVRDGVVRGMLGTEEVELRCGERRTTAWTLMDIAIEPALSDSGLGLWMLMTLMRHTPCAITIGSNPNSFGLVSRFFHRLPDRRSWVHPVDLRAFLARRVRPAALSVPIAFGANLVLAAFRAAALGPALLNVKLRAVERFDASVVPLFERARRPDEMWFVPSVEFLNWRLFESPRTRYHVWSAHVGGALAGYLAAYVETSGSGPPRVVVADWLCDPRHERSALRALLHPAFRLARDSGASVLQITAYNKRAEAPLPLLGFRLRPGQYETFSVGANDEALLEWLTVPRDWQVSEANTDRDNC